MLKQVANDNESNDGSEPSGKPVGFAMAGCFVVAMMFGALASWTIFVGVTQNKAIAQFSEDEQREYPISPPTEQEKALLETKLKILAKAAETKQSTTIDFSANELNALIMTQDLLADFRTKTRVKAITSSHIEFEMSQPVRKLPLGFRFVNGTYFFRPQFVDDGWHFHLLDIDADAGEVDPNFLEMFQELQLLRFDTTHEAMSPVLKQLKSTKLENGRVILEMWEGEPPVPGDLSQGAP
ncbi:MAG: hypothetical protein AAF585_19385 [Verrucomicrobiota bacterium]